YTGFVPNVSPLDLKRREQQTQTSFSPPPLCLKHLTVSYKKNLALQDLSGTLPSGTLTAVVGPNGGGRSTLLKVLAGMVRPTSGGVKCNGLSMKDIAYLPQQADIDRTFPLTVCDVVAFGLCQKKGFFSRLTLYSKDLIMGALEEVGMADCAHRSLDTLSGGQFQRVLLARLSLQEASVILLDEPFAAIDRYTIDDVMSLIHRWHGQGRSIIVVCHDLDLVRDHFPNTLLLARRCLGWGKTEDILTR